MAWLKLLRFPNIFTLCADVLMAWFLVQTAFPISGLPQFLAAFCVAGVSSGLLYWAGMVLNDVHDYEEDCELRPERPLPSGEITRERARRVGFLLLGLGFIGMFAASFWSFSLGWTMLCVVLLTLCVFAYNTRLKNTWFGPVLMGLCRGLNVFTLMSFAPLKLWLPLMPGLVMVPLALAVYICGVTLYSRGETERDPGQDPPFLVPFFAVLTMVFGLTLLWTFPQSLPDDRVSPLLLAQPWRWMVLLGLLMAWLFFRCLLSVLQGPLAVRRMMKPAIFMVFILDAAVTFAVADLRMAVVILALMIPAVLTGRVISST